MTDNMNTNTDHSEAFRRQKSKEEMQRQLISFALMIVLTLIAFAIVMAEVPRIYVLPVLFVMAIVQAGFQFYYFMHMKEKGHAMPATLIYGGVWAAFLTLAGLMVISWW